VASEGPDDAIPGWAIPVLYGLVTLVLFRQFVISDAMLFGSDTLGLGYVARAFYAEMLRQGTFPLWNPRILGGTPFLESLAGGDSLYPTSLLLLFQATHRALGWKLVLHVFAAGLFMFAWVRALGVSRPAALVSGLAYLMAPFMVTLVWPGHDGKIFITALTPLLFWLAERTLTRGVIASYAALALGIGVVILSTHFQAAYFLFGALGLYYVLRCAQRWRAQRTRALVAFALFLGAALAGAGVAAVQLLPAVEYVTQLSRRTQTTTAASPEQAREYSSSWGLHPEEVGGLLVPEFVGSNVGNAAWATDTYWGRNFFKHNHEYAGLVVLIFASLAFVGGAHPGLRWFLAGLGAVAILFGLGEHTPVWGLFYDFLPGVSLFRAPSIAAFLFGFSAITLMALGLDRALSAARGPQEEWRAVVRVAWGWVALLALLALLAVSGALFRLWTALVYTDVEGAKLAAFEMAQPFIVRGLFVSTALAACVALVLWALRGGLLKSGLAVGAIGLLALLDAGRVDDPFLQTFDFHAWSAPDATTRFLMERQATEEPFRVFSMIGANGQDVKPAMHGLELAAGHHPNDLGRYRELIGMVGSGLPQRLFTSPNILPILNVRYILWPTGQIGPIEGLAIPHLEGLRRVSEVALPDGRVINAVYAFPGLARARLVGDVVVVPDTEAVATLESPDFDPTRQVVLAEAPPVRMDGSAPVGSVRWIRREVSSMELRVEVDRPALLVLAENWTPSWEARVDGEPAPVLRANYVQRAVPLAAGQHVVELRYSAAGLLPALWITLLTTVGLIAVLVLAWARRRRGAPEATGR
jgi:hypothetical protein